MNEILKLVKEKASSAVWQEKWQKVVFSWEKYFQDILTMAGVPCLCLIR